MSAQFDTLRLSPRVRVVVPSADSLVFLVVAGASLQLRTPGIDPYQVGSALAEGVTLADLVRQHGPQHRKWFEALVEHLARRSLLESDQRSSGETTSSPLFDRLLRYMSAFESPGDSREEFAGRLAAAHVLLLGTGTLGSWLVQHFVACGIGRLTLVDRDSVELSNLARQGVFAIRDVGASKTAVLKRYVEDTGFPTQVSQHDTDVRGVDDVLKLLSTVGRLDLVVLTADDPRWALALWVQEACLQRSLPLLRGNSLGAGPLVVPGDGGGCVGCELGALAERLDVAKDHIVSGRVVPRVTGGVISTLPAMTAAMVAHDAVHFLARSKPPATLSRRIRLDEFASWSATTTTIVRRADCDLCT